MDSELDYYLNNALIYKKENKEENNSNFYGVHTPVSGIVISIKVKERD
jgi:hypothetical protein